MTMVTRYTVCKRYNHTRAHTHIHFGRRQTDKTDRQTVNPSAYRYYESVTQDLQHACS